MNNLHRELAPVSDVAWSEIAEETSRTIKRYLAGRRVVDVQGPAGMALSAIGKIEASRRISKHPGESLLVVPNFLPDGIREIVTRVRFELN